MEHKIVFLPAWDKTDPDPSKDYGISDVEILFLVVGDKGIVEFQLGTNWHLPHVVDRRLNAMKGDVLNGKHNFLLKKWITPFPLDVCCFSLERLSEDDLYFENLPHRFPEPTSCYYSYKVFEYEYDDVATDYAYKNFIEKGIDWLWEYLEKYYREVFEND